MIAALVVLAGLAVAVVTAGSFARDWRLAMFANFRAHLAATAAVLALLILFVDLAIGARLALAAALGVAVAVNLREMWMATREPPATPAPGGARLRLAFANVLVNNREHQRLVDWVRAERPDVFIAAEVLKAWPAALAVLDDEFPFSAKTRMGDVMIFSRRPIEGEPVHVFAEIGHAVVVTIDGVTVAGLHTASPEDLRRDRSLRDLIARVGDEVCRSARPAIVVGDFNAAPWTAPVLKLMADTGLACGPGARVGTFPAALAGLNFPTWAGIPIDIVLAGRGARVVERRHGPKVGSDHWPVIAEVEVSGPP